MARLNFLAVTEVSSFAPVMGRAVSLLSDYSNIRSILLDVAPNLADLFAEPVFKRRANDKIDSISWYTVYKTPARKLSHLDDDHRDVILAKLNTKITQCKELFDHSEIGAELQGMLCIPDQDAIMAIGREAVIVNWGLIPIDCPPEEKNNRVNGLYTEMVGLAPLVQTIENENYPKDAVSDPDLGPVRIFDANTSINDGLETSKDLNKKTLISKQDIAEDQVPNSKESTFVHEPDLEAGPYGSDDTSFKDRWILWTGWIAFALLLFFILLVFWWYYWGQAVFRPNMTVIPTVNSVHNSVMNGLQAERDRLLRLLEDPCGPQAIKYLGLQPSGVTRGNEYLADSSRVNPVVNPEDTPTRPENSLADNFAYPSGGERGGNGSANQGHETPDSEEVLSEENTSEENVDTTEPLLANTSQISLPELAKAAEKSVVLILVPSHNNSIGMGSGFFITPKLIVTNRHVIEGHNNGFAFITSEWLGSVKKAKIIAMSSDAEIGNPDFALLELRTASKGIALPINKQVDKLMRVVTSGYPTYLTKSDPELKKLMRGDLDSSPKMVFTSGEVSVIQSRSGKPDLVIHTADMSQGNSGGPLLNGCGDVVGVNTFIGQDELSGRRGLYSISGKDLQSFLKLKGVDFQSAENGCSSSAANQE